MLYLCLAQRLALPLEMITPPGHIYVRYHEGEKIINIETTARGIHVDCEEYLGMNNRSLQQRNIREVIGMAHFNQASVYWQKSEYEKALKAYQKAAPYMQGDPLLKELTAYALLATGQEEEGKLLLKEIKDVLPSHATTRGTMAEDCLQGHVDIEGLLVIFKEAEEDRPSILAKKQRLEEALARCPRFRAGVLSLALSWLQLHRLGEALETLKQYLTLDLFHPEVHYYLALLYAQRHDYSSAWHHLQQAEAILKAYHYYPQALKELKRELLTCCPE